MKEIQDKNISNTVSKFCLVCFLGKKNVGSSKTQDSPPKGSW